MLKRIISAVIGAPLILILTWLGGWYLAALVIILALLALKEYLQIGEKAGFISNNIWIFFYSIFALAIFFAGYREWLSALIILWLILIFGRFAIYYPKIPFLDAAYSFLGFIYPVMLFSYLYNLRESYGIAWSFFVFFIVWVTDTGAFFAGNVLGKRKLAPRVSPNKSVEGAIGGVAASLLLGCLFWLVTNLATIQAVLLVSLVASAAAQVGDLFESALKRTAGLKDSGNLIPGHGGILDRFDSFFFALPIIFYALELGLV